MSRSGTSFELNCEPEELPQRFHSLRDVRDVADLLEVEHGHLVYILYWGSSRYPYRSFNLRKRSGGVREISVPPSSLHLLQSKLNSVLQIVYQAKPSVHGFLPNRSILTNALRHTAKRFVLNVDLEHFFPSINFGRVRGMFMAAPYNLEPKAATVLAQICCHDNQLPQGAPTSPIVSNMICAKLDGELQQLAQKYKCTYTRYADDLTFSTTRSAFPEQLADSMAGWGGEGLLLGDELVAAIKSNGFKVNVKKQRLRHRKFRQEVTGLIVNKFPNVRRRFVRQVRAMLHALEKYGYEDAQREFRERYDRRNHRSDAEARSFGRVIRGKLDFLKMVKGEDDPVYRKLRNQLHSLAPAFIDALPEQSAARPDDRMPDDKTWQHWFQQYKSLVFQVVFRRDGREFGGTAFAWRRMALATCAHNLEGEVYVSPPFPEGESIPASTFVFHGRRDEEVDVAVLRLSDRINGEIPLRANPPNPGEQVAALGYPSIPQRQPALAIHTGFVESRAANYRGTVETFQVSIEIAGGMSGGPVIDRGGKLVGIVLEESFEQTAENVPSRTFRHVLPIEYLREIDFEQDASGD